MIYQNWSTFIAAIFNLSMSDLSGYPNILYIQTKCVQNPDNSIIRMHWSNDQYIFKLQYDKSIVYDKWFSTNNQDLEQWIIFAQIKTSSCQIMLFKSNVWEFVWDMMEWFLYTDAKYNMVTSRSNTFEIF